MNAYTTVDPQVRRKLEEMFMTWQKPPPFGNTQAPVFPVEYTRKIDLTLQKVRAASAKLHQEQQRRMFFTNGTEKQVDDLVKEVESMIATAKNRLVFVPTDESARQRIGALEQLKNILSTSALPLPVLEQVRQQLSVLKIQQDPLSTHDPHPSFLPPTPPLPIPLQLPPQPPQPANDLLAVLHNAGILRPNTPSGTSEKSASALPQHVLPGPPAPNPANGGAMPTLSTNIEMTTSSLQKYV